jgi:electron transport complex protein RnfG
MKTMIKLSFILALYASVACVALAFVYNLTAPRIEASKRNEVKSALREVCPDATDFLDVTGSLTSGSTSIIIDRAYVAKSGDAAIGMVLQVTGPTYKSSTLLVSVGMSRAIDAVRFLVNSDTPGIGTKTAEPSFIDQFKAKSIDDSFKTGNDVQAISGATISSKAVASILKLAGYRAGEYLAANYGAPAGSSSAPVLTESAPMELQAALADLFPGADFTDVSDKVTNTVESSIVITGAWLAKKDGKVAGIAVQAKGQTYKASTLLVGVAPDRTLSGVRVNATTDSKKYGYPMVESDFYGKFTGKSVDDDFFVTTADAPGDVDALSGATISSMGFANIAKVAAFEGAAYLASSGSGAKGKAASSPFALNQIPEEE